MRRAVIDSRQLDLFASGLEEGPGNRLEVPRALPSFALGKKSR
jgi:hypothetical protein